MKLNQSGEEALKHYSAYWGNPKEILSTANSMCIGRFELDTDLFAYGSIGMSEQQQYALPAQHNQKGCRTEIFIYSSVVDIQFVSLLTSLMEYPFFHKTNFAWGHTVPGAEFVINSSAMTDILFLPPLNEDKAFYSFHLEGVKHVDVLWMLPIYRSETVFLRTHPWRELLNRMIDLEIDTADFNRSPVA